DADAPRERSEPLHRARHAHLRRDVLRDPRGARPAGRRGGSRRGLASARLLPGARYGDRTMKRFWMDMNPTLRGFLIILTITGVVVALSLYSTLAALYAIARIAFFIAIAFFVFLVWRERRGEISLWSTRAQVVFYAAAVLVVVDLGVFFWRGI